MEKVDYLIVGGGLFGVYAALYLSQKKYKVCLLEKEQSLFRKASIVNQARLHEGYHYPRSIATALMAQKHKERFVSDHQQFINSRYDNYYAVDKFNSTTSSQQFERFCQYINIPLKKMGEHPLFNKEQIENLYLTREYTFDPINIAAYYVEKLARDPNITLLLNTEIKRVDKDAKIWTVDYHQRENSNWSRLEAYAVINATYAGTNSINAIFGMPTLELMYEISEIAFIKSADLTNTGLTVIDGPFASFMPYGHSGLISLSSVPFTHHKVSYATLPAFDCQQINSLCRPDFLSDCSLCIAKPVSNQTQMIGHIKNYLNSTVKLEYLQSLFTIKTKLKESYIDDGRPTEISKMNELPAYYCLFSGKINSIYEIEKLVS